MLHQLMLHCPGLGFSDELAMLCHSRCLEEGCLLLGCRLLMQLLRWGLSVQRVSVLVHGCNRVWAEGVLLKDVLRLLGKSKEPLIQAQYKLMAATRTT